MSKTESSEKSIKQVSEVLPGVLTELRALPTRELPPTMPKPQSARNTMKFEDFKTFGDVALEIALREAKEFAKALLQHPYERGYTLTLCGPSGVGKTMLSKAIFSHCGWDAWGTLGKVKQEIQSGHILSRNAQFYDWRKVSDAFKSGHWELVEAMEAPLLLGLDDVGADYDPNLIAASKLDRVLRSRRQKWTVVNCNLTLPQIADKLDPRIASFLIRDGNRVVEVSAKDYALRGISATTPTPKAVDPNPPRPVRDIMREMQLLQELKESVK